MLRVSTKGIPRSSKPLLKGLFDAVTLQSLMTRGLVSFKKAMEDEIGQVVEESLNDVVLPAMQRNLILNKSIFTSALYNLLKFKVDGPGRVVLEAPDGVGTKNYAAILESGSKPRDLSGSEIANIVRWVIHKRRVDEERGKQIALHVIERIESKGNVPHPYIEPAMQLMMPVVQDVVKQRLQQVFRP